MNASSIANGFVAFRIVHSNNIIVSRHQEIY